MNDVYTAGLIDGEGTVTLTHRTDGGNRYPTVSLTSTSRELIDFMVSCYGGTVCNQKTYKVHHKSAWIWTARYDRALEMLRRVYPYMKEEHKRARTHLLLSEYKLVTVRNGQYTEAQRATKLDFEARFMAL